MTFEFAEAERIVDEASRQPTNSMQKAACATLSKLDPAEKLRLLRLFIERHLNGRYDWSPHVYVHGAIGPRDVLPWSRDDVVFLLDAAIRDTASLPPRIAVRAVKAFLVAHELDTPLRKLIARAARSMWPDDDGEGAELRDSAAALRAVIGEAVKPKPKKKKVKKEKPPKKPKARTSSFAEAVKRQMALVCPSYRFIKTSGGSGPIVTFERPRALNRPHLTQHVDFQKGLHGASWFRVSLSSLFEAPDANGASEHVVLEGAPVGKDVPYANAAELEAALAQACESIERVARTAFAATEKQYPKLDNLFTDLVGHYARFLKSDGARLSPDDFVDTPESNPPTVAAFDAFVRWLSKEKRSFKNPGIDLVTPLWQFWHHGRPMRASDYRKGDFYTCTSCGAFASFRKGKLVARKGHFAFVCSKH